MLVSSVYFGTAHAEDIDYNMTAASAQSVPTALAGAVGQYKDFQTTSVNHEKEINGTDKFAPASFPHYLPRFDNEKGKK